MGDLYAAASADADSFGKASTSTFLPGTSLLAVPYRSCISTLLSILPPALHIAFATLGAIRPDTRSVISAAITFAKSCAVLIPFSESRRLRGWDR